MRPGRAVSLPDRPLPNGWTLFRSLVGYPSSGAVWANGQDRVVRFYRSGTQALAAGILMVAGAHRSPRVTVWIPAYFCEPALALVRGLNVFLKFYPIRRDMTPDWQWIEADASRSGNPQVFLLMHYFGFPAGAEKARTFCDLHGMVLIEDAAHILPPTDEVGRGDFVFFCPHKQLAVPQVGVLVTSSRWTAGHEDAPSDTEWGEMLWWAGAGLAKQALIRLHVPWHGWRRSGPPAPQQPGRTLADPGAASIIQRSRLALKILAKAEEGLRPRPGAIVERRRWNYQRLLTWITHLSAVQPLVPMLADGVCPSALPLLMEGGSRAIEQRLWAGGILTYQWRDPPPEVVGDPVMKIAARFYDEMLWLPVHQDLSGRQIDLIGQGVATAVASRDPMWNGSNAASGAPAAGASE